MDLNTFATLKSFALVGTPLSWLLSPFDTINSSSLDNFLALHNAPGSSCTVISPRSPGFF